MSDRLKVDDRFTVEMAPPTVGRLEELAREGFRSIVNLRAPDEQGEILSPSEEGEAARRHGLEYVNVPVSPQDMNEATAERFDREVSRLPSPVAIHCASGKRAGLFTFLHIARTEGLSGEAAVAKAETMGFQFASSESKAFFTRAVDDRSTAMGGSS